MTPLAGRGVAAGDEYTSSPIHFHIFPRPIATHRRRRYIRAIPDPTEAHMKPDAVRQLTLALLAVALAAVFAACGSDSTTAPPTTGPFTGTIQVRSNFYSPASATIAPGDSVTWVWSGSSHSVTEGTPGGAHAFDSGVKANGKFGHRF